MVLPYEEDFKAEAKKRQGTRNDLNNLLENFPRSDGVKTTRDELGKIAGLSGRTLDKAKVLMETADEETKEKLRNGSLSIHGAFTALTKKEDEILPGHTAEQILTPEMMGYTRPSDDVYDTPGVTTYGNMPSDNKELRGRAEMVHAKSSLEKEMENHVRRVFEILKGMSSASINEENIAILKKIVIEENSKIIDQLKRMEENSYEEE